MLALSISGAHCFGGRCMSNRRSLTMTIDRRCFVGKSWVPSGLALLGLNAQRASAIDVSGLRVEQSGGGNIATQLKGFSESPAAAGSGRIKVRFMIRTRTGGRTQSFSLPLSLSLSLSLARSYSLTSATVTATATVNTTHRRRCRRHRHYHNRHQSRLALTRQPGPTRLRSLRVRLCV